MAEKILQASRHQLKRALRPVVKRYSKKRVDLSPSLWRLSRDAAHELILDDIRLSTLLEQYGSPLHIVDATKLDENVADFLHTPHNTSRGCEVYYSYKTNPIPGVLQRMHSQGIGAEVISAYELWLAVKLGVAPKDIVYNGPAKSLESQRQAIEQEIGLYNFNNREEIAPFAALAHQLKKRPRVGVRIVVPGGWGGQFGEPVGSGAAMRAFEEAAAVPELQVVALHVHLGAQIASAEHLSGFVSSVLTFCDELHARLGIDLEIIDFGGSLTCPTTVSLSPREKQLNTTFACDLIPRPPNSVLTIRNYVAELVAQVERHYKAVGRALPRIFLEPGRAMTGNTQMLLCRVVTTRAENDGVTYAVLDAGVNLAESVRGEYHQLFPVIAPPSTRSQTYRLAGPICTPSDVIYDAWDLPELKSGDALAIMDSGAYFVPFATSFSFPQPSVILCDRGNITLIRRAETFDDLISLDNLN